MFGFVSQTRAVTRRLQTLATLNLELAREYARPGEPFFDD